jgi:cytoskeleton protein RodZ
MSDFGAKLRAARERRGVSLRQIADTTKISISALEALERDDPSRLPGGIFTRAFVRSYATEVGLDPEVTVREFLERFDIDPGPLTLEAEAAASARERRASAMFFKIVLASLLVAAFILYFALARRPASGAAGPADHARTSRRLIPAGAKPSTLPRSRNAIV